MYTIPRSASITPIHNSITTTELNGGTCTLRMVAVRDCITTARGGRGVGRPFCPRAMRSSRPEGDTSLHTHRRRGVEILTPLFCGKRKKSL